MSKRDNILQHLKRNGSITSIEAVVEHSAFRLAGHIFALREKRWPIITERRPTADGKSTYARYHLNLDRQHWPVK